MKQLAIREQGGQRRGQGRRQTFIDLQVLIVELKQDFVTALIFFLHAGLLEFGPVIVKKLAMRPSSGMHVQSQREYGLPCGQPPVQLI